MGDVIRIILDMQLTQNTAQHIYLIILYNWNNVVVLIALRTNVVIMNVMDNLEIFPVQVLMYFILVELLTVQISVIVNHSLPIVILILVQFRNVLCLNV